LSGTLGKGQEGGIRQRKEAREERQLEKERKIADAMGHDRDAVQDLEDEIGEVDDLNPAIRSGLMGRQQDLRERVEIENRRLESMKRTPGITQADMIAQREIVKDVRGQLSDTRREIEDRRADIDREKRRRGIEYARSVGGHRDPATGTHSDGRGLLASWVTFRTVGKNRTLGRKLKEELRKKKV